MGGEDPLEKEIATHSSILAWKIPRTEEPGGLQSKALDTTGHKHVYKPHTHKQMYHQQENPSAISMMSHKRKAIR